MNRYVALGCLGLGLMVSPLLGGTGVTAVPADPKIGFIDWESTMFTTPAGKRAGEAFEKTRKTKQGLLDKEQDDLKRAESDLMKKKTVLSDEMFRAEREKLERKFVDLQQTYVQLERELAQNQAKMISDLLGQAVPKIMAIAKAEGVTLVLDKRIILWADPAADLTQKLNARMK